METIERFDGEYRFLSNFAAAPIRMRGLTYPTVEHAYQAAKTEDDLKRQVVRAAPTPGAAKMLGRKLDLRPDWDAIRVDVMRACLRVKFAREPYRSKLLATGYSILVEGNDWGDRFWGVCDGRGENRLGCLLMDVRSDLRAARPEKGGE